jgi:hypothetical protein
MGVESTPKTAIDDVQSDIDAEKRLGVLLSSSKNNMIGEYND